MWISFSSHIFLNKNKQKHGLILELEGHAIHGEIVLIEHVVFPKIAS